MSLTFCLEIEIVQLAKGRLQLQFLFTIFMFIGLVDRYLYILKKKSQKRFFRNYKRK